MSLTGTVSSGGELTGDNNPKDGVLVGGISRCSTLLLSAYAIAVKHGFEGTEAEWLESLRGEPGAPATDEQVTEAVEALMKASTDRYAMRPPAIVSFIDDDCRTESFTKLFPIIKDLQIPWCVACPPGNIGVTVGYMSVAELQEMVSYGVTVSCHHKTQTNMNTYESADAYAADLDECLDIYEGWGITNVNTVCYPQGVYADDFIGPVKERFKMGFTTTKGINQMPYESYFMKRVEVFPQNNSYTLDDVKDYVNEVAKNGGWLILMTHAWYPTFNADNFRSLVKHIQDNGVEIVSVDEAIERTGNIVEVGLFRKPTEDLLNPYFVTDATGRTFSKGYAPVELPMRYAKLISTTGPVVSVQSGDVEYMVTEKVDISGATSVLVSGWASDGYGLYVFYDDAGNRKDVRYSTRSYSEGGEYLINEEISVPDGATCMAIAGHFRYQSAGLKKIAEEETDHLPNPYPLTFTGAVNAVYNGEQPVTVEIPGDDHINSLINAALGVIENGSY